MARFLPASMALLLIAAMVLVAPAASSGWVPNPSCSPYPKYETLGEFAVNRYNEQNHGSLRFVAVESCQVLDRGTGHYTYRFVTIVDGGDKYNEQNHGSLRFVAVESCQVLDRGTGHYTYRFVTIVDGGDKYNTEVLEDLSAPYSPPVHNFGYFISLNQPAQPPKWQHNPTCRPYAKYGELGLFAVQRYNEQNHGSLMLWAVKDCWVLDRGTGHYTFRFITIVRGGRKYRTEVLEDLSAPGRPPVHNFGYFRPI
ncbi:unnamed protein product [Victoria cruziana]